MKGLFKRGAWLSFLCALCAFYVMLPLRAAPAPDPLWPALQKGGHILLIRHALTDPGIGDPPGFTLADCASQRNLSAAGREHAQRIGAAFRQQAVPVTEVLSSRWCRCVDTATLAFGRVTRATMLDSIFNDSERPAADKLHDVRQAIARYKGSGNLVLVTHAQNISALSGESVSSGEMVVLRQEPDGLKTLGRLTVP